MSLKGQLTDVQRTFLKSCAESRNSAKFIIKKMAVPRHRVEQWMESRAFRKALRRRLNGIKLMRDLDISRGAEAGARRLTRAALGNGDFKKDSLYERRACVDLVRLAMLVE